MHAFSSECKEKYRATRPTPNQLWQMNRYVAYRWRFFKCRVAAPSIIGFSPMTGGSRVDTMTPVPLNTRGGTYYGRPPNAWTSPPFRLSRQEYRPLDRILPGYLRVSDRGGDARCHDSQQR